MPENESKRDAFRRLATQRTNAVLERLRILGRCANRQSYEYDSEDVNKIFRTIEIELRDVKAKFKDSKQTKFTL
jgi:hypothetical protein